MVRIIAKQIRRKKKKRTGFLKTITAKTILIITFLSVFQGRGWLLQRRN